MKKKNIIFRVLSVILLLAMVLSSCAKKNTETDDTTNTDTEQNIDLSEYILISDEYKLIRPENGNDNILDMFKIIHGELTSLLGSTYPYGTDFVERGGSVPQDKKEILLGLTNRDDSKAVFDTLDEKEYKLCV